MEKKINDKLKILKITKWLIGVVTACILIYLAIRHLDMIAAGISWLVNIMFPLLSGVIIAFILNVPMHPIEKHLHLKHEKSKRPLAIFLSLVLVLGIFTGVAFLVLPEIVNAVRLVAQIILSGIDQATFLEENIDFSDFPFGEYLEQIDIDWVQLKINLQEWTMSQRDVLLKRAAGTVNSIAIRYANPPPALCPYGWRIGWCDCPHSYCRGLYWCDCWRFPHTDRQSPKSYHIYCIFDNPATA